MRTKVILSAKEKINIGNTEFFSVKREIISKVQLILGEVAGDEMLNEGWRKILINEDEKVFEPKISKGENYHGLPYLILDFPKKFNDDNQFAVRNFFWWGKYFATFLLLSGKDLENFLPKISANYSLLQEKDFFISTNDDRWIHSVDEDYYSSIKDFSKEEFETSIRKAGYLKLATHFPISEFENATEYFAKQHLFFQLLLK